MSELVEAELGNVVFVGVRGCWYVFERAYLNIDHMVSHIFTFGDGSIFDVEDYDMVERQPGEHRRPTQQERDIIVKMISLMNE